MKSSRIYLDYASTTPIDKRVALLMEQISRKFFYNPSALYEEGRQTRKIINEARKKVASVLQSKPDEIFFTSGGTESNNIAIQGIIKKFKSENHNRIPHIITSSIEHSSVLEVFSELQKYGVEVTFVSPDDNGLVHFQEIMEQVKDNTILISLMYGNNEIGTISPISRIFKEIKRIRENEKKDRIFFHTDASQGAVYLNVRADYLGADLVTLDGSKLYGPRGVGVMYKKRGVKIEPIVYGGGHEEGIKSGTENTASIAGFAEALNIAEKEKIKEGERLVKLRDHAFEFFKKNIPGVIINGDTNKRLPNNINICIPGLDAEFAVIKLDLEGIACSSVTTCRNIGDDSSSYVIDELYKNKRNQAGADCSHSSLRISIGRNTKKTELDMAVKKIAQVIKKLT
jgi:cysteine desulfurase